MKKWEWEMREDRYSTWGTWQPSQTGLSDTTEQPSVRPAECYFQHEMTHQLYQEGVGERRTRRQGKVRERD